MSEINFQPIFEYIDGSQREMKDGISNLQTQVANISYQLQVYHQESQVSKYRLDRLEDWVTKAAGKIDTPIQF